MHPVIKDTLIPVLEPGTNDRLAKSWYVEKRLGVPALTEGDVQELSAGIAFVLRTGCTYRQVWKHRRNLAREWSTLMQRRGLLRLLKAKRAMDANPTWPDPQVEFLELLIDTRVGIDRKELVSLGWGRELLGQELSVIARDPEPLTFQEADLVVEACTMLGNTRPSALIGQVPVQNLDAISAVAAWWPRVSAEDRELVHAAWWWWRGFAPLYRDWVGDMQALFTKSKLARAIAANWAADYRDPLARPAAAQPRRYQPDREVRHRVGCVVPSAWGSRLSAQDYAPRLPIYNGGWFPGNSPVVPIFGR